MRAAPLGAAGPLAGAVLAGALFSGVLAPREAAAQSVTDCMEASPARALSLCRTLIDEGRDNADVWAQLALSLDKSGRAADARAALDDGLDRYPKDADLLALRDRLAARGTEEERLRQAARRNESAVALGELKLLCRTRRGAVGIEACRRYLEMTDVDGERIRKRLAALEGALPSVAEAPAPEPPPRPEPSPGPTPDALAGPTPDAPAGPPPDAPSPPLATTPDVAGPDETPADPSLARLDEPARPAPDPDTEGRRARVAAIQRALDALGLPVGAPDGIAGRRTREALERFQTLTGRALGSALDEGTLAALESERARLGEATAVLARSRAAAREGRLDEALELLARAESGSALLRVPPDYRNGLERDRRLALAEESADEERAAEEARRRAERERQAEAERSDAPLVAETPPDAGVPAPGGDAPTGLLVRIGALERRLAEADAAERREEARLRALVQRALGGS